MSKKPYSNEHGLYCHLNVSRLDFNVLFLYKENSCKLDCENQWSNIILISVHMNQIYLIALIILFSGILV